MKNIIDIVKESKLDSLTKLELTEMFEQYFNTDTQALNTLSGDDLFEAYSNIYPLLRRMVSRLKTTRCFLMDAGGQDAATTLNTIDTLKATLDSAVENFINCVVKGYTTLNRHTLPQSFVDEWNSRTDEIDELMTQGCEFSANEIWEELDSEIAKLMSLK